MKSLDERANEYANSWGIERPKIYAAFEKGAKSERDELLKWNNPKCPPEDYREILVKVKNGYNIASYNQGKGYCIKGGFYTEIIGWREIHELY